MTAYRFIDEYKDQFGVRWLLRRLNIFPNAYYNYKTHRKAGYEEKKQSIKKQNEAIYHGHNGVDDYRIGPTWHIRCFRMYWSWISRVIKNAKRYVDFTYLFLENRGTRYNCTILDLHDRSLIASIIGRRITADLAVRTLRKAIDSQPQIKGVLVFHSDYAEEKTMPKFFFVT